MGELVPTTPPVADRADLSEFESALVVQLAAVGLPSESVFVPLSERGRLINNLGACLEGLPVERRARSLYLSKMVAAAYAGLFDAALNYLWDETVGALRERAAKYDLSYFFDVAVSSTDRRRALKTADDLSKIDDIELLRAAREIGLVSSIGHAQLDHIRHMRNHASAAHPNQIAVTGLSLANWLEICLKEAIEQPLDNVTAETAQLLRNIKERKLDAGELAATAAFFDELPGDRPDALAAGFFGLYAADDQPAHVRDNVVGLWPRLWPHISDEQRYEFGTKYARFIANADQRSERARELLDLVGAAKYMPDATRLPEIEDALDGLLDAHRGLNNFYSEPAAAAALQALIGDQGEPPTQLRPKYAATLVEVFLTNGNGNAWNADPHYRTMLGLLESRVAGYALRALRLAPIEAKLQYARCEERWIELLEILRPKITRQRDRELLAAIDAFDGPLQNLARDPAVARLSAFRSEEG